MSMIHRIEEAYQAIHLSREEINRYSRHLIIPEITLDGQRRIKAARVLCIGAGGLGSPLLLYLAAAGVGQIGIVDYDTVDFSNLQRQILHTSLDVGIPKVESARNTLLDINPNVNVHTYHTALDSSNALEIFRQYDIIVDGTDNFPTRYLVNDACVLLGKPNVYGSIFRFDGQVTIFWAARGPCYRCLYPEPPPAGLVPSCAEGGVLGVLPGVIGTLQATEILKLITGTGQPLIGRLLIYDALKATFKELKLRKNPSCPICGSQPTITQLIDYEAFCGSPAIEAARRVDDPTVPSITPSELKSLLEKTDPNLILLDIREPHEAMIVSLPGFRLIPPAELPRRLHELDSAKPIILICKNGARSADAVKLLQHSGFAKVWNVRGGLDAYAKEVDSTLPTY